MVVLGLGEENVVRISTDEDFRIDVAALERAIARDESDGMRPMAVVATVGTTSTASIDPVREIAALCSARNLWLHVDAAYGGALAALPEGRWVINGAERADSFVVNPHKWLFVPLDFSVLFMRDPELLRAVFALTPEYLEGDAGGSSHDGSKRGVVNYMDYGIQLGRRFRALKAWMVFRAFGRNGIVSRLREHRRLASLFAAWASDTPGFSLAAPQSMGVVCFRYTPLGSDPADADRINVAIAERVNASGDAYITWTRLRGRVCLRVGIGNVLTTETHLRHVWDRVREAADSIRRGEVEEVDHTGLQRVLRPDDP